MNARNNKAITLIALVVTIVVLLILAGVSISMLSGDNGIITKAEQAKNDNEVAEIEEQVALAVMAAKSASTTGDINYNRLKEELAEIEGYSGDDINEGDLPRTVTVTISGVTVSIDENGTTAIAGSGDNEDEQPLPEYAGKTYGTETDLTIGDVPVTIPGGATISGIRGECESVDNGLVIYIMKDADGDNQIDTPNWNNPEMMRKTYDQFVWVPVETAYVEETTIGGTTDAEKYTNLKNYISTNQKYPMAIKQANGDYKGILYNFTGTTSVAIEPIDYTTTSSCREPAYLTSTNYADGSSHNNVTPKITQDLLQTEFNTMVGKVADNKGFWVGRYETSNMVGTESTKSSDTLNKATVAADSTNRITVIKGTTTGISYDSTVPNYINWYRMYAQQKNYANLANITSTSSMIWGSQWDQIMIWMKGVKNTSENSYYVVNSLTMGNFGTTDDSYADTSKPSPTGCYDVKNVYDLAGNVYDWTLEACTTEMRVIRRRLLL